MTGRGRLLLVGAGLMICAFIAYCVWVYVENLLYL